MQNLSLFTQFFFSVLYIPPWDRFRYGRYVLPVTVFALCVLYPYYYNKLPGLPIFSDEDIAAFDLFDEVAKSPANRLSFFLERGEVLVLNNYTVMHARTEFRNFLEPERQRRLIRLWLDRPGFRDVPKEFNLFKSNGVPPQPGKRATFDFKKLYAEDPVATGGMPKL